jgi:hypothetical protein
MTARPHPWLAFGLFGLAAGLATVSLLGPLVSGIIEYHVGETLRNQTIGLDAVGLAVVAPLAVVAGRLALRGHAAGPALGLGIGTFTTYMFVQYILGPDYLGLPGNNELLFPLYLALFALGWVVALTAWHAVDAERLRRPPNQARLLARVVLPLLAFLAFFRYVPALADAMSADPAEPGYREGPTFFWTIAMLDLGVFLPATIATCWGVVRGTAWAPKALYTVAGWFALVGPAVAAMAIAMAVNDDPNASAATTAFMATLGLAFAVLGAVLYRPLFSTARRAP